MCPPGFTGANCEMEEDECVSSPCAKDATCVDKVYGTISHPVWVFMKIMIITGVRLFA